MAISTSITGLDTRTTTTSMQANVSLGMSGWKPSLNVSLPIDSGVTSVLTKSTRLLDLVEQPEVLDKIGYLSDQLVTLSQKMQSSTLLADIEDVVKSVRNFATMTFTSTTTALDTFETSADTILYIESIMKLLSEPLSFMSIFKMLYILYKMIKMLLLRVPKFVMTYLFGQTDLPEQDEFVDALDEFATTEAGVQDFAHLGYTGLIMMLPLSVRQLLDSYQRYTRVKILEDVNWISDLSLVFISIPDYILAGVEATFQNIAVLSDYVPSIQAARESYQDVIYLVPELSINSMIQKISRTCGAIHSNQHVLQDVTFVTQATDLIAKCTSLVDDLHNRRIPVPVHLSGIFTELKNYIRESSFYTQTSHPEPVAILLYSGVGQGKTTFVAQVRQCLTKNAKNSIYDYTPTDAKSDFHDQYKDQNIWIHEDIGQRSPNDWAQYIMHIGSNPSKMDGAALDKKGTIFFKSQAIIGTTNVNLAAKTLSPTKDCGWVEPEAIYRRWLFVNYRRESPICDVLKYHILQHRFVKIGTIDCQSPESFCDTMFQLYQRNVAEYNALIGRITTGVDRCIIDPIDRPVRTLKEILTSTHETVTPDNVPTMVFTRSGMAEGRKITTTLDKAVPSDPSIRVHVPTNQMVYYRDGYVLLDVSETEQRKYIDRGMYINGAQEVVSNGQICITDNTEGWNDWVVNKYENIKHTVVERTKTSFSELSDIFSIIPQEYRIAGAVTGLLSTIASAGLVWYFSSRKPKTIEEYQPFLHWAKTAKKTTASKLYGTAEGLDLGLLFKKPVTTAMESIQSNVLKATFSYGGITTFGYVTMIDHDTAITTAHLIMETSTTPSEIFVRGFNQHDTEVLSTHMKIISIDLEEDVVYLKYKHPHAHVFRSLHKSLLKTPTNKCAYILATEGCLELGIPEKCEVSSGYYRNTRKMFHAKEILIHHYDGIAKSARGLCGALAVTMDGYVLGWHVAGLNNGTGYVRFWDRKTRDFVLSGKIDEPIPIVPAEFTGAMKVDTNEYHHVTLKSGMSASKMFEPMMEDPLLSDDGKPCRLPAELGGKDNGVKTYDRSRTKNLVSTTSPINTKALEFATLAVKRKLNMGLLGKKISKLTESEMVKGFNDDRGIMNRVNLEASAGAELKGTVKDWVDMEAGTIHEKLKAMITNLERNAKQGIKDLKDARFKDCNKDELRDAAKIKKPRCFAAGPVHYTMALRKWFGSLQATMMKTRHKHGIMIGINATSKEWGELWRSLCRFSNHFDGDYAMWDGAMRREFQEKLNELLASLCEDEQIGLTLLTHLCETVHVGLDLTYLTSHSVPSGHGLTALYNSLINNMYVAYAWYMLVGQYIKGMSDEGLVSRFLEQVYSPTYGDDIVCGVHSSIADKFNAISYSRIMDDIGLGFTSASKEPHTKPFNMLRDITFLKRHFAAHREINDIVGPLDINVLRATAAFIHDSTRDQEITAQKMSMIQRELYLHSPEMYNTYWASLLKAYKISFESDYHGLTREELHKAFTDGELRSDLFEANVEGRTGRLPGQRKSKKLLNWKICT
jgi:hypothetical protein